MDLSGANLSGANLSGANLSGADLSGANLGWADLSGGETSPGRTSVRRTSAWRISSGRDLSGASLSGADLSGANLGGADLSGADIREATDSPGSEVAGVSLGETRLISRPTCGPFRIWSRFATTAKVRSSVARLRSPGLFPKASRQASACRRCPITAFWSSSTSASGATCSWWTLVFGKSWATRRTPWKRHDDRLSVTFRSAEDFQTGLETVVAQLAAQEQMKPGVLDAFTLKATDAGVEIGGAELRRLLGSLAEALRSVNEDMQLLVSHKEHEDVEALTARRDRLHEAGRESAYQVRCTVGRTPLRGTQCPVA